MANLSPTIRFKETYDSGLPLVGGKVWTYQAGSSTPLETYSDFGGTLNTNPVILNSRGEARIRLSSRSYKFVVTDADDNEIYTEDNISIPQAENGFTTGNVKLCINTVADAGWVMLDDKTIGSGASAATGRANDDTEDLFKLLWNNFSNSYAAISGGVRGVNADADWAANKTINLPKALGRVFGVSGAGSGLSARSLGEYLGEEDHTLITGEIPSHNHTQDPHDHTQDPHTHLVIGPTGSNAGTNAATPIAITDGATYNLGGGVPEVPTTGKTSPTTATNQPTTATNQPTGGDGAHNNIQPTLFLNAMIKL
jgi:microcystin-dependent protein